MPSRGRSGAWMLALGIALLLAVQPIWPDRSAVGVAGALALTLAAATRWQLRWLPVVVLIACGIVLRLSVFGEESSDVADVTRAAVLSMLDGGNPYGVGYDASRPAGAPFPYGPVALLWYLPSLLDPTLIELTVSLVLLAYFGVRAANGRPVGLAVFAVAPPIVLAAMDGSNDTSAGLFILLALVAAVKRPMLGAGLLAVAVAFKPYAVAWLPPLVLWAGLPTLLAFAAVSVVAWGPILFIWGPASYLRSLAMAQETHLRSAYWSLGSILNGIAPDAVGRALETVRYFLSAAVAVVGGMRVRSIDGVIAVGTITFLIAQFGGYFGSYVYLAAIAPILCWRADDWLHRGLPDVSRAYGAVPELGRRTRRSATAAAAATAMHPVAPPVRLGHATHAAHPAAPARLRSPRPTRNPTG